MSNQFYKIKRKQWESENKNINKKKKTPQSDNSSGRNNNKRREWGKIYKDIWTEKLAAISRCFYRTKHTNELIFSSFP